MNPKADWLRKANDHRHNKAITSKDIDKAFEVINRINAYLDAEIKYVDIKVGSFYDGTRNTLRKIKSLITG